MSIPIISNAQVQAGATLTSASGGTVDSNSLMGQKISAAASTTGQTLVWNGSYWVPTVPSSSGTSWLQYVTGYVPSSPPTVNTTIASGTVYNYTYTHGGGTIVYYRLVPVNSSYTDAFYTTFSGGVLSGLIVSKGITV